MSDFFTQNSMNLQFMLEMLLANMIYMIPLEKRDRWPLRAAGGSLLCFCLALCVPLPDSASDWSASSLLISTLSFAIAFLASSLLVWFVCQTTGYGAFFCGGCAYATQHFAYSLSSILRDLNGDDNIFSLWTAVVNLIVLVAFYRIFARRLPERKRYDIDSRQCLSSVLLVVFVVFVLSSMTQTVGRTYGESVTIVDHLYAMFCCAFLLWVQVILRRENRLQNELNIQQQLWHEQEAQYESARANIEIINRKCHDLKYQLAALRMTRREEERSAQMDEIERAIQIYDTSRNSGNEVLDTVLTEKALYCEANQISMTCVADGQRLGFMEAADIYSIFGNALDNAIECAGSLKDPERRLIGISVWTRSGLLLIQIENYYEQPPVMKDGFPVTTKKDTQFHGYGVRSIQYTAEKYGGVLSIHTEDHLFILRVTIPLPGGA